MKCPFCGKTMIALELEYRRELLEISSWLYAAGHGNAVDAANQLIADVDEVVCEAHMKVEKPTKKRA